ncbi:RagB/SusD family nutrient uptake outer membrane protein [Bacteroides congonensis]
MKHILGSCVLAGLFLFCACDDTLDTKVTWQIDDSDTWRVPELAQGVLYKAYNGIANRPDCFEDNFLDCATDNAVTNARSSSVYKVSMGGTTEFANPIGNWTQAYNMLNYVNSFLENGLTDQVLYNRPDPAIDKQIKLRLEGESYFLRAWWHFELLKMYGGKAKNGKALGIPLADHFISQEEAAQNGEFLRPTYQATVDFIVNDLNKAIELLPSVYQGDDLEFGTTQIGRATKSAAGVLKSRVLLYSASPAMQDDDVTKITGMGQYEILNSTVYQAKWEAVAKEINKILSMDGFGVFVPVTAAGIADAQTESADYAFRRYFNNNLLEGLNFPPFYYGSGRTAPSHNLVKAFYAKNGYPVTDTRSGINMADPNFSMMQLYAVLDNRFALNVYYHSSTFGDSGQALDMSEGGKDSPSFSENATRTGYYLAKFVSKKSAMLNPIQTLNSVHYNPLLRKSEVLFNFAEAANEAWGNPQVTGDGCLYSAYEIMKNVRSQAGGITFDSYLDEVAQSKDSFRKLIQNERRLEFAFESHRYFDMRRWVLPLNEDVTGVAVTRNEDGTFGFKEQVVEKRKYEVKNYFAPLPYSELAKNKNLVNNQGWE